MKDPASKFYIYGKDVTDFLGMRSIKFLLVTNFPKLGRILNLKLIRDYVTNLFRDVIKTTIAIRDSEHTTRLGMIHD